MVTATNEPDNDIRQYYLKKKKEGKHHSQCVVACTTKLLRTLYAMSNKETLYSN
jgi:hypothetical protein